VSAASDPIDFTRPKQGKPEISAAAQQARERLHEEIERVRLGVEELLDEGSGGSSDDVRGELEELRLETRNYVKRKVRKSEKRLERSLREMDARTDQLERRVDQVEQEREQAEWRIHNNTEAMLDDLLREVRAIADRLTGQPKR
jgi:chromosome segregation ATPase